MSIQRAKDLLAEYEALNIDHIALEPHVSFTRNILAWAIGAAEALKAVEVSGYKQTPQGRWVVSLTDDEWDGICKSRAEFEALCPPERKD